MTSQTLREQRIKLNLSIAETANRTRLDPSLISRYESGNRIPTREHVLRLAEALMLDKESLLVEWFVDRLRKLVETDDDRVVLQKALRLAMEADGKAEILYPSGSKVIHSQEAALIRLHEEFLKLAVKYPAREEKLHHQNRINLCRDLGHLAGHSWHTDQIKLMLDQLKTFPDHDFQSHMFIYELHEQLKQLHPNILRNNQFGLLAFHKKLGIDEGFLQGQDSKSLLVLARLWVKADQLPIYQRYLMLLAIFCQWGFPLLALPRSFQKVAEYSQSTELAEFLGDWLVKELRNSIDFMHGLEGNA